jgi:hypothetical protein
VEVYDGDDALFVLNDHVTIGSSQRLIRNVTEVT